MSRTPPSRFRQAAAHSYLGQDLLDVVNPLGREVLRAGSEIDLLLIPLWRVVLFPGETLPLRLQQAWMADGVRQVLSGHSPVNHIGIAYARNISQDFSGIGTIIEVRSISPPDQEEVIIMSKGRHRFRTKTVRRARSLYYATIVVLADDNIYRAPIPMCMNHLPAAVYHVCRFAIGMNEH